MEGRGHQKILNLQVRVIKALKTEFKRRRSFLPGGRLVGGPGFEKMGVAYPPTPSTLGRACPHSH